MAKKMVRLARYAPHSGYVSEGWHDSEGMLNAALVRQMGADSFAIAQCPIDLYCLGPKDGLVRTDLTRAQLDAHLARFEDSGTVMERCAPELVAKIVDRTLMMRMMLEIPLHPDVHPVLAFLKGIDPEACDEEIPLGQDGEIVYVNGPFDDIDEILGHLDRALGEGGYRFEFLG